MRTRSAFAAALAAAAVVPAAARADAPWSPPATVPSAVGYADPIVFTAARHGATASAVSSGIEPSTRLTPVSADGSFGPGQVVPIFAPRLAAYASDRIVLAGAPASVEVRVAPVALAVGTAETGVGAVRALPGTAGQQLLALAGSPGGVVALVTGTSAGHRERVVWVRRGGSVRRALTIRVSERARGAAVAVGRHGDVLVAWEDGHQIFSRHLGPSGRAGSTHRLGAGVQSLIEARYDDSSRQEVAWETQRVSEGDALSAATVWYTSAALGHGFTRAVNIGRSELTGTGRYVAAPGVRLVGSGTDSSVLAFTVYDGAHFRVRVANAVAGRVQAPLTVSPDGEDDVLGDLAYARAGGTVVLWRCNVRGADATGPSRVFAGVRPSGLLDFGPPEAVSDPIDTSSAEAQDATVVPAAPFAAVDPQTGAAVAVFGYLSGRVALSVRPAR